jgi:trans-aconitate 2-methyltransferase
VGILHSVAIAIAFNVVGKIYIMNQTNRWNAKDYANNSSAQAVWAEELITKLNLRGTESILDLGCGDGKITAAIASKLDRGIVWGIDRSLEMISLAREKYANSQYSNLFFQQMDAKEIHLEQQFDIVFSNAVLHWIEDHLTVLQKVNQHLKPKGKILWQMGGKDNTKNLLAVIDRLMQQPPWQKYFLDFVSPYHFYDINDYDLWLDRTGFQAIRIELISKDMQHQGKEGLKGWLRTTWFPYTDRLPEALKEQFLDRVIEDYTKNVAEIDDRGNTHVQMMRLEVEAIKTT